MKQLQSNGLEIIRSTRHGPPRNRPRAFNPVNIFQGAGPDPFSPVVTWALADGNDYAYYYAQGTSFDESFREVNILLKTPPTGYTGPTGGVFYNASIRSLPVLKFLT